MADEERTRAELLTIFANGQGPGEINPQDMRDYVVTTDISNLSTGVLDGGIVTVATDTTEIDIAAGTGVFIDNHTTPLSPVRKRVTWTAFSDVPLPLIGSTPVTFVALDISTGSAVVVTQPTDFTPEERRDLVILGVAVHSAGVVTSIGPVYKYALDARQTQDDLALSIGAINVGAGNNFSANATGNLTIDKSAGQTFSIGNNYENSQKSPNITIDAALVPIPFFLYTYQDVTPGDFVLTGVQFSIDPNNFDDGTGSLAVVSNNAFTTQRIWFFSEINLIIIHYGQTEYTGASALADAAADISTEEFVRNPGLTTGFRGWLIVQQGATDLTIATGAKFIDASMFGDILRP